MNLHATRLQPGADLRKSITEFAQANDIRAGFVASAVGSLSTVAMRMAGARRTESLVGEYEILSVHGTISSQGSHLHMTVSDEAGAVVGGHLVDGCVIRTTCELVIVQDPTLVFGRVHDPVTEYDELSVLPAESGQD